MNNEVVGPPSCKNHTAHVIGCLDCAYEVAIESDGLDDFLDHAEDIGWQRPEGW